MRHTIGEGSEYDADMGFIELVVKYENDKAGAKNEAIAINTYYYSQLRIYWDHFKNNIFQKKRDDFLGDAFIRDIEIISCKEAYDERSKERRKLYPEYKNLFEDIKDVHLFINLAPKYKKLYKSEKFDNIEKFEQHYFPLENEKKYILDYWKDQLGDLYTGADGYFMAYYYKSRYDTKIDFIKDNLDYYESRFEFLMNILFKQLTVNRYVVNNSLIEYIFTFISGLQCSMAIPELLYPNDKYAKIDTFGYKSYLLTNDTGLFGLNTYLYAFFEGIFLHGMPKTSTTFDDSIGCPYEFFNHDVLHSSGAISYLKRNPDVFGKTRELYYKCLNSNIGKRMKELMVMIIWICTHEIYADILSQPDSYFRNIVDTNDPFVTEFNPEIVSLNLAIVPDKQRILETFPMADDFQNNRQNYYKEGMSDYVMLMLNGYLLASDINSM